VAWDQHLIADLEGLSFISRTVAGRRTDGARDTRSEAEVRLIRAPKAIQRPSRPGPFGTAHCTYGRPQAVCALFSSGASDHEWGITAFLLFW
jgi:hypothetical protein